MLVYGSMLCPDCVQCCKELDEAKTDYTFCDFAKDLSYLKEFLKIRETEPIFEQVKQEGKIGIPCIVYEDGTVNLDWK